MGAAAGKQFQSEKAKHAQAVLSAVEVFDEANNETDIEISTELFKKKVMLAASDAKRNGKDIEKSLAQLTDADLDMLAKYMENRKAEERMAAANAMRVEEVEDQENGADNIDETTSVLSYGDDEEEQGDELDSSGEVIENIEEVVDSRPRLNSGYKVFPMEQNEDTKEGEGKLKIEDPIHPQPSGMAERIAKFWECDELGSATSHNNRDLDSPLASIHAPNGQQHSPSSTVIGKKYQPSPKQSFPYKDRGQRIDEGNETLMVLQRQKVISLTQNAQLEREVEALQKQLEKMDQFDQTLESTNRSNNSLNNTANSSNTVTSTSSPQHYSSNSGGVYGSGKLLPKYSYIYPIDEEVSQSAEMWGKYGDSHSGKADAKASVPVVHNGAGQRQAQRQRRDRASKAASSPSSSDNDSISSHTHLSAAASKHRNITGKNNPSGGGILRVRSTDHSDLSDDGAAAPLGKVGRGHSNVSSNNSINTHTPVAAATGGARVRRVRMGASNLTEATADSDDSTSHSRHHPVGVSSVGGYQPSQPSVRNGGSQSTAQAKHSIESDSDNTDTNPSNRRHGLHPAGKAKRSSNTNKDNHRGDNAEAKRRDSESDRNNPSLPQMRESPSGTSKTGADPAKQISPKPRAHKDLSHHQSQPQGRTVVAVADAEGKESKVPRYQALMDNVGAMLVEAVRKESDNTSSPRKGLGAPAGAEGSRAVPAAGRGSRGGALKKLNRRRHSMDGLEDSNSGAGSSHLNAADTSQDEIDAYSPKHKYNRYPVLREGGLGGAMAALAEEGSNAGHALRGSPLAAAGGEGGFATTDDESVGARAGGAGRSKLRRPRAKLFGQAASSPLHAASGAAHSAVAPSSDLSAVAAVGGGDSATGAAAASDSDTSVGVGSAGKPKRRVRAGGGLRNKPVKENSHLSAATTVSPWDKELDHWWAEVSLLLRKPILQEEDMLYTVAAAEAGLIYTEEMNAIAKSLNVLRGALSRWILPFDHNTRIDSQCSTPHSVVENMPEEFRGKLTERQVHYLVAGANGVRKLVRVKIADDNDLQQAQSALKSIDMFFKALYHRAQEANITPYQLLKMAETFQP